MAALASALLPGSRRDSLLVGFDEGKLSICEYDPLRHDLSTVSMHMFEEDDLKVSMWERSWTGGDLRGAGGSGRGREDDLKVSRRKVSWSWTEGRRRGL